MEVRNHIRDRRDHKEFDCEQVPDLLERALFVSATRWAGRTNGRTGAPPAACHPGLAPSDASFLRHSAAPLAGEQAT